MQYIVLDLEWNGAYSKQAHGYFNEIIEIGAVRLNEQLQPDGKFHVVIRPQLSRKRVGYRHEPRPVSTAEERGGRRRSLFARGS